MLYFDLYANGHNQGMSRGETLEEAKQLVRESRPDLGEFFRLVPYKIPENRMDVV